MNKNTILGCLSLIIAAGVDAADSEPASRFSWDNVPVCIHFGKSSGTLTDEELQFVARTADLVCLEKGHGKGQLGSTEKGIAHDAERLKALNPGITVLYYWNAVLNYQLYDACSEAEKNPTWILRDTSGQPICKKGTLEQYNLVNPAFRQWWASEAGRAVKERHCDGIFMDAVPQVARILKQMGGAAETKKLLHDSVIDMMRQAKTAMGQNSILLYNGLRSKDSGTTGEEYLPFADGAMVEHFTAFGSGSKAAIVRDIEAIAKAGKSGKMVVVKGWPSEPGFNWLNDKKMKLPPEQLAREARAQITFSLACFLLAAQENSYFCYSWGYREQHGSLVDYPEFYRPLGAPEADYTRDGWRFTRSFKHARVSVDLSTRTANIEWISPAKAEETKPKDFKGPVKVFVMAGQSNIAGYAGKELLDYQANAPETKAFFAHLRDGDKWVVFDDVFVKFGDRRGPLTIGYGAPGYTGIEYEFGYVMGQHLEEPVLIIKVWGGALYKEFRPPSAPLAKEQIEAERAAQEKRPEADNKQEEAKYSLPADAVIKAYGGSYRDILAEVANVFENRDTLFPQLKGMPMEIAGFVWFQGWSDQHPDRAAEYERNLACFIRDLRKDLKAPAMPFVIPMIGFNGSKEPTGGTLTVQNAQWAMNAVPEFKGNVKAFRTDVFVDKPAEALFPTWRENLEEWKKIGSHWACHYYGSALWYTKIGRAAGEAMTELMQASPPSNQ